MQPVLAARLFQMILAFVHRRLARREASNGADLLNAVSICKATMFLSHLTVALSSANPTWTNLLLDMQLLVLLILKHSLLINAINIKVSDAIITIRIRLHQTVLVVQICTVLRMLFKPWLDLKLIVVFLEHHYS